MTDWEAYKITEKELKARLNALPSLQNRRKIEYLQRVLEVLNLQLNRSVIALKFHDERAKQRSKEQYKKKKESKK